MTNKPTNNSADDFSGNTDGRTDGLTKSSPTSDRSSFTFVPRTKQNPIRPAELMRQAVAAGLAASRHRSSESTDDEARTAARAEIEAARHTTGATG